MSEGRYVIRKASAGHLEALFQIDPVAAAGSEIRREEIRKAVQDGSAILAMRAETGEIVGYGVLNYSFYEQGFIPLLAVHPAHRRNGAGSALMRYMEAACRTTKLFTSTNQSNRPMRRLLTTLGYSRSGIIHNLDEGDPEIVYSKALAPHLPSPMPNHDGAGWLDRSDLISYNVAIVIM